LAGFVSLPLRLSSFADVDSTRQAWGRMTSGLVDRVPLVFVLDNMRIGGTELNAVRTAELLDRRRFDLRVVCLGGEGPLRERYRSMDVPVVTLPVSSLYGRSMLSSGRRFSRYIREERVQIVHAHDMYSNIFATPWARLASTPVVITSRRWWHSLPNKKLQLGNRAAFRLSSAVLANSPQVARSVEETDGVSSNRVWIVSNFVDESAYLPAADGARAATRAQWGVPADALVIGCVARLVPVKDHANLLRAFAQLGPTHPQLRLALIGDGECRGELEALASELGIAESTIFAGELRDGGNHHHLFDISVLCSLSEGFPNSLVEAMAASVPIVATRVGGNIDAVVDGENGILVPVQRPQELAEALRRLVGDASLRRAMGMAGCDRARGRYSAREAVGSLESMYERLLEGAKR
jgi:L-malate glycosyltransferase